MRWLPFRRKRGDSGESPVLRTVEPPKPAQLEVAPEYEDLRTRILRLRSEELELTPAGDRALALLMETGYADAVMTLVTVADGQAGIHFSNGRVIDPGVERRGIRTAAAGFLAESLRFITAMSSTATFPYPAHGFVRFYLVTEGRVLTAEARENDLGYDRHALSPLFHEAHRLIAAIRQGEASVARTSLRGAD